MRRKRERVEERNKRATEKKDGQRGEIEKGNKKKRDRGRGDRKKEREEKKQVDRECM